MAMRKQKYDRQLRIWEEHGQKALESAEICVLNCGPTATEALKNLVLGGIGSFTIVDGTKVEPSDLGNNFLVDYSSLGESKSRTCSALLQELNEAVGARFVEESPESLIQNNPGFFKSFSLVIATQLPEALAVKLDKICRENNVALLIGRSYGLVGSVRVSVSEHCVVESKPESTVDDLRLHKPWPALLSYANKFDLDCDDSITHKHIPFGVILIQLAEEWKKTHGDKLPSNYAERSEFKELLTSKRREFDEENYGEALSSAFKVWSPPSIGADVSKIINDKSTEVDASSSDFWIMTAALRDFLQYEGDMPLNGSIPDMHSATEFYIGLQQVYQAKSEADISKMYDRVGEMLKKVGRAPGSIPRSAVKKFCKNAFNIGVFRYLTLEEEFSAENGFHMAKILASDDNTNASIYVLLRAVDHFAAMYSRFPGTSDRDSEGDVELLTAVALSLLGQLGLPNSSGSVLSDDMVVEMCRFGAGELHCVAAIVGGVLSQEAIKLMTGQFTPIVGTWIYNGMASTSLVLNLQRNKPERD